MDNSVEIAKILFDQESQKNAIKSGFDSGLMGLGVGINVIRPNVNN